MQLGFDFDGAELTVRACRAVMRRGYKYQLDRCTGCRTQL